MATTQNWVSDSQATVIDGMNRGREPELISEQQAHLLRNLSIRGGRARSRPRFVKRATLPAGKLQGASVFRSLSKVIITVGGRVYELDPKTWASRELTGADVNSPKQARVFFCETQGTLLIQDDQSRPFVYDGDKFRRAADDEVPVGGVMSYGNGRLAVVVNGNNVRIGDIRTEDHQSELKFTETFNLLGGGDFAFPSRVNALGVLPVIDSASGQGSLIVGCESSVHSLKTQITQRDLWSEVGFSTVLLPSRGISGGNALVAVNQDLFFRSSDGLRSIRTSTADYDAPGLAPLSVEVRTRFDYDTPALLQDASVVYFDNRVLCTHSPFVYSNRALFSGIVALNFDGLSGRGSKSPAAFDGEWDGLIIAQLFTGLVDGVERCFVLGREASGAGTNGLWEIQREVEVPVSENPTQVLETRMLFGTAPGTLKNLRRADVQFSAVSSPLTVRVYFRPDKYPFWVLWDTFTATPQAAAKDTITRTRDQYRPRFSTRTPASTMDPQTNRPVSQATGFQVRVEFEGNARIDLLQVFQEPILEQSYAAATPASVSAQLTPPAGSADPVFWYSHPVSPLAGIS